MTAFFQERLAGNVPLATLLWRDMIVVASLVNVAVMLVAIVALERGLPIPAVLAIFFSPLPYNIFLWTAVWRTTAPMAARESTFARGVATVWLFCVILL